MSYTYTTVIERGGTGKTTTSAFIWHELNRRGFKTLAVDYDPQMNLSLYAGVKMADNSIYDAITGDKPVGSCIYTTKYGDIIPGARALATIPANPDATPTMLKKALKPVQKEYQYIVIDTARGLDLNPLNALMASDAVVIPAGADTFTIDGIIETLETVQAVQKQNKGLRVAGILLTRYKKTKTAEHIAEYVRNVIGPENNVAVFNTPIRESVKVTDAQARLMSLMDYAPKSPQALDYLAFIDDLLNQGGRNNE